MALTYAQQKRAVNQALRKVRQAYRPADTAGERVQRELDRLISRKTLVTSEALVKLTDLYDTYAKLVTGIQGSLTNTLTIANQ